VFLVAVHAGVGASEMIRWASALPAATGPLRALGLTGASRWTAALLLLWLPFTLPWWWNPPRMDAHFVASLDPLPADLPPLGEFLRAQAGGRDVVLAGPAVAPWIPALSGRRVLRLSPPPAATLAAQRERAMLTPRDAGEALAAFAFSGVRFVIEDPSLLKEHALEANALARHPLLTEVYRRGPITVYRAAAGANGSGPGS
jgi:hypothetical protein